MTSSETTPEPCTSAFLKTALCLCSGRPWTCTNRSRTAWCQSLLYKDVVRLQVSMHNARLVQECKQLRDVEAPAHPLLERHVNRARMQQVEQSASRHVLEHDGEVRRLRAHAHQHHDFRVSQQCKHLDFVSDFWQQVFCDDGVEDDFDGDVGGPPDTLLNHAEAALTDLVAHVEFVVRDLHDSGDRADGAFFSGRAREHSCFRNFVLENVQFVDQFLVVASFELEVVFEVFDFLDLRRCGCWSGSGRAHPIFLFF